MSELLFNLIKEEGQPIMRNLYITSGHETGCLLGTVKAVSTAQTPSYNEVSVLDAGGKVFGSCTVGADMSQFTCTKQQVVKESYPQVFECTQWSKNEVAIEGE